MGGNYSKLDHMNDSLHAMKIKDERNIAKHGNSQNLKYVPRRHVTKPGSVTTTKELTGKKNGQ